MGVAGLALLRRPALRTLPVFVCYPFVVALHSAGAAWGVVSPPASFETTAKTDESSAPPPVTGPGADDSTDADSQTENSVRD